MQQPPQLAAQQSDGSTLAQLQYQLGLSQQQQLQQHQHTSQQHQLQQHQHTSQSSGGHLQSLMGRPNNQQVLCHSSPILRAQSLYARPSRHALLLLQKHAPPAFFVLTPRAHPCNRPYYLTERFT